MEPKWK